MLFITSVVMRHAFKRPYYPARAYILDRTVARASNDITMQINKEI